jgi:molecular chaperone DnaK
VENLKLLQMQKEKERHLLLLLTQKKENCLGQIAKRQAVINPENTFYSVKRFIGRKTSEVNEELRQVSYKVLENDGIIKLSCPALSKQFAAEEISAQLLRKLADDASKYLGETVTQAVTQFLHILMIHNVKLQKMRVRLLV